MLILKRPWTRQPQTVTRPDQRWLSRGLVYVSTMITPHDAVLGGMGAFTGTKAQPWKFGMARGFYSTLGAGTTDQFRTTLSAHAVRRTYIVRVFINGTGGLSFGRVFDKLVSGAQSELIAISTANIQYSRSRATTGTDYRWARSGNIAIGGAGGTLALSYDSSSTSNAPRMYYDGVLQTPVTTTGGSGAVVNNSDVYVVGNRGSDSARGWDGLLSDFLVFDEVLTDSEIAELSEPARVWAPQQIIIPTAAAAASSLPTLSASTYVPGSLTSTGWRPQITAS